MTNRERMEEKLNEKGFYPDKLTYSKNVWTFKKSYFYKMGQSADELAAKLTMLLPELVVLSSEDKHARWPKTSYFIVKFEVAK
jgi:hypothetical protein